MFKNFIDFIKRLLGINIIPFQIELPKTLPTQDLVKPTVTIPFAIQSSVKMTTKGVYQSKYPIGAVVHYSAGRFEHGVQDATDMISYGISKGYTYLCISSDGCLVQAHPINEWGYHAGESSWRGMFGGVSDELIGIEMCNAGLLTKEGERFKTWFGTYIDASDVRYVTESEYGCPTGYYHRYTLEQETTLIKTLHWLKKNDLSGVFNFDLILGHHEVAGKKGIGYFRKSDPGGSLSMTMQNLRDLLNKKG